MPDPDLNIDQYLTPSAPEPPPVESIPAPTESPYVSAVRQVLDAKYVVLLAYVAFGDQLRTADRDGLYRHFQEHVEEEREWIYKLHRSLASMGDSHTPTGVTVPSPPLADPRPMLESLLALELHSLAAWDALAQAAEATPERLARTGFAQEGATVGLSHIEDLRRWLGGMP